jgi:hypothetical protein
MVAWEIFGAKTNLAVRSIELTCCLLSEAHISMVIGVVFRYEASRYNDHTASGCPEFLHK